jgi:hypothetical protein
MSNFSLNLAKTLVIFCLVLTLAACSAMPKQQVNQKLNAWQGQNIESLIKYWGLPNKQSQVSDKHFAEWISEKNEEGNVGISIGGGRSSGRSGVGIGLSLFNLGGSEDKCSRVVTYGKDNIVRKIEWQGDSDYCFEVTPELTEIQAKQKK